MFSALYLQGARGMSPFESGLVFLALSAGAGSASYFSGRLAEKFPADRLMAIGMLISAAGIVALTSVTSLWLYTALFLVTGVGLGLGWALSSVATQAVVQPDYVGAASGVTLTSLVMLGAVGVAIGAALLEVLAGSAIGGIAETQEMLDFCAKHNITADVEVISPDRIEEAYERTLKADVRYRFVIDMQSA